jgi:cellulose synthase/poly-beta-1,6-N-acetylglucosamine synthase-like glycosyltransferase
MPPFECLRYTKWLNLLDMLSESFARVLSAVSPSIMVTFLTEPHTIPAVLTLLALGLLVYAYAGYPVLLWCVARLRNPLKTVSGLPDHWPTVTVVISACNEERVIVRRIQNLLAHDYPKDRVQVLIGSDGSTDRTNEIVKRYRFAGVQLTAFSDRRGKASVLNDLVMRATGEYLVFTDAATVFYPDSIKELMTGFYRYPTAGVIGGELELRSPETSANLDGLYWRCEMFLKMSESKIGGGLGASGAIYALRRKDYRLLPPRTMADDLLEPMLVRLHTKRDVVLHKAARAWQFTPQHMTDEFHRRIRTGGGITHVLTEAWRLLLPEWGTVAFAFWSHKVLRLCGPWILLTAMVGTVLMLNHWMYRVLFLIQVIGYGLGLSSRRLRVIPVVGKAASAARYFLVLNLALGIGTLKYILGLASPTWSRTTREPQEVPEWKPQDVAQNR